MKNTEEHRKNDQVERPKSKCSNASEGVLGRPGQSRTVSGYAGGLSVSGVPAPDFHLTVEHTLWSTLTALTAQTTSEERSESARPLPAACADTPTPKLGSSGACACTALMPLPSLLHLSQCFFPFKSKPLPTQLLPGHL